MDRPLQQKNLQSQGQISPEISLRDVDGKLRQTLSKIRGEFRKVLGEGETELYTIEGDAEGVIRIALDRKYVTWTDRKDRTKGYLGG